jgi:hypothetical protein
MSNTVFQRDGVRPIIYSRHLLINDWLSSWSDAELNIHYYWLAQYLFNRSLEHPGPPTLPYRVSRDRVILHQTADKKPPFGGEVESKSVDWDRWLIGGVVDMHDWIEDAWGTNYHVEPTMEEKVQKLWEHHPELH